MSSETTDTFTVYNLSVQDSNGNSLVAMNMTLRSSDGWTDADVAALAGDINAAVLARKPASFGVRFTYSTDVRTEDIRTYNVDSASGAVSF